MQPGFGDRPNRMFMLTLIAPLLLTTGVQQAPAAKSDPAPSDRKVCRRIHATVSRIAPPPVCKTQAEWDAEARAHHDDMERGRNRLQNPGN